MSISIWLSILMLLVIQEFDVANPLFLEAMTSALATIPFSGAPMTTGLVGAKLAMGTQLLYNLGFYGRPKLPNAKPKIATPSVRNPKAGKPLSVLSSPYPPMASNFKSTTGSTLGDTDLTQIFLALRNQGIDPTTALQMIESGVFDNLPHGVEGFGNLPQGVEGFGNLPQGVEGFGNLPQGIEGFGNLPQGVEGFGNLPQGVEGFGNLPQGVEGFGNLPPGVEGFGNLPQGVEGEGFTNLPQDYPVPGSNKSPEEETEEIFSFVKQVDDDGCMSRLVCSIGKDPTFIGPFSDSIHNLLKTAKRGSSSVVDQYLDVMETGRKEGGCVERYPECADDNYEEVLKTVSSAEI